MRFLSLHLLAYGPFRDLTLDFSAPEARLHVLHGRNEAGKSTTLRAVMGLLYGIPKNTPDAHLHRMPDLRVGGRLEASDGTVVDVVRRKGNANTLLGLKGESVDEAVLKRMLGSVGEDLYRTTFGLDHETLREGGKSLLLGKGDLGESLFQAGLGGAEVHHVLAQLRAEADAIFTARAYTRPLNDALKAHAEAQKKVKDSALSADVWTDQKAAIENAAADIDAKKKERAELILEQKKAQRARRVLPILGKRAHLRAQSEALGEVVSLPETAVHQRLEASREQEQAVAATTRLLRELSEIDTRRAKLVVPESLVDQAEIIQDLYDRLGAHKKAAADYPALSGALERSEDDARRILQRIGRDSSLEKAESLRLDTATQARIRRLARESARLEDQARQSARAVLDTDAALSKVRAREGALLAPRDAEALRRAVDRAQQQGDLEGRARSERTRVRKLTDAAEAKKGALGGYTGALRLLPSLPIPSSESVERFAKIDSARALEEAQLDARTKELTTQQADLERETDALLRGGAVPTEVELNEARDLRDLGWSEITRSLKKGDLSASSPLVPVYEQRVRDADGISDRLRREAERATRLARLRADEAAVAIEAQRIAASRDGLRARASADSLAWLALWAPASITPLSPAEMRAWLARYAGVAVSVEQLDAAGVDLEELDARIESHSSELSTALQQAGEPPHTSAEDLASLVARGVRALAVIEAAARDRRETLEASAALVRDLERSSRERDTCAAALLTWKEEWAAAISPLALDAHLSPDEAAAVLDELVELFRCLDDAKKTRRRVTSIDRDALLFAGDVARLAAEHAPDLAPLPCVEAASKLHERAQRGRLDRAARAQHDVDLEEKRAALAEQKSRAARADETLASLMRAAHVDTMAALEEAERRAQVAATIARDIAAAEQQLLDAGDGATVDELVREARVSGPDEVSARLDTLETRLRELEDELAKGQTMIARSQMGLEMLSRDSLGADAAADAQEALARVRRHVERYVRVRLASIVLSREIERYREKNQAPVLALANDLFRRLTLGAYTGLRAGFDERDQAVLCCVRNDGREVDVEGLSDGTRDQLYLALRLASLERHARANEAIPLVFDDILIHFDDDRARAALEILGEFAQHTQILFFTHHARLVALAREAIPGGALGVHELGVAPAGTAVQEAMPFM